MLADDVTFICSGNKSYVMVMSFFYRGYENIIIVFWLYIYFDLVQLIKVPLIQNGVLL